MTDKYILVKVRDAETPVTPGSYTTKLGKMRKAIHLTSDIHDISVADMVTHSLSMTAEETEQVANIFDTAMERAKRDHKKRLEAEWEEYYANHPDGRR